MLLIFGYNPWITFQRRHFSTHLARTRKVGLNRIAHRPAIGLRDDLLDYAASFDHRGDPVFRNVANLEPTARSAVIRYGARVACRPSSGGIWIKLADLVELDFLELDRWNDTPRQSNQTREDEFCTLLEMIGAEWWELPPSAQQHRGNLRCATLETCFQPNIKFKHLIAWPETEKAACVVPTERALARGEKAMLRYHNAMNMEERCEAIRSLGGKFCKCPEACREIKDMEWGPRHPGPDGCDDPPSIMFDVNDPNRPSD